LTTAKKASPSWSDVKVKLANVDRSGLLGLLQDLYAASKDNKAFLHARFALGDNVLEPYKVTIDRWLYPDTFKNQSTSIAKAKRAVSDYHKAIGKTEDLAELTVFFCERASSFSNDVGLQDENYFHSLLHMFEQALKTIATLPEPERPILWARLDQVCRVSHNLGYGVGDNMSALLAQYDFNR
jgi:hypothetical protein